MALPPTVPKLLDDIRAMVGRRNASTAERTPISEAHVRRFDHPSEHAVGAALAARYPCGEKQVGWPMILVMRLTAR